LFSPQELEDFGREMGELKKTQGRHENYATVIEIIFLLLVGASSYTEVYVSYNETEKFFTVPISILLNIVMLYSVVKMRFAIQSMPNLFPNESLVLVHVLLFTEVSVLWLVYRVYSTRNLKAGTAYLENPTVENDHAWFYASYDRIILQLAYNTVDTLLNLFML